MNLAIDGVNVLISGLNRAISIANKLPFVDIGKVDSIDRIGASPRTAAIAPGTGRTVNVKMGDLNVSSPNADPAQVAVHARQEFEGMWATKMLEADMGVA